MDTLKDIWASLVAGVQERTTNPLSFAFIVSWCLWNFKLIFILAGDGTTAERLHAVDMLYPCTLATYLGHAFGAPLATALFYVFVYPSISAKVIDRYRRKQVAIANSVREIEGARLLTAEESRRQIREHELERTIWQETETTLRNQLREVREALQTAEREATAGGQRGLNRPKVGRKQSSDLHPQSGELVPKSHSGSAGPASLDVTKVRILLHMSKYSTSISIDMIAVNMKLNPTFARAELMELEVDDYVFQEHSDLWGLTLKGAALAVRLMKEEQPPEG